MKTITQGKRNYSFSKFLSIWKYEANKTRPLKMIVENNNMLEITMRNARKLKGSL